jgi:hypothetical protein
MKRLLDIFLSVLLLVGAVAILPIAIILSWIPLLWSGEQRN